MVSPVRTIISKIHLELTPGYGHTIFLHKPEGLSVVSSAEHGVGLFSGAVTPDTIPALSQWFHRVEAGGFPASSTDFYIGADSTNLRMSGPSNSIPLNIGLYFVIDRFKIGGGFVFEPLLIGDFHATKYRREIGNWRPDIRLAFVKKYYGMIGANIIRYNRWLVSADARIGLWNPGRKFDMALIQKSLFYNVGGGVDYELSEYFHLYARPSLEFKSYTLSIPETQTGIKHLAPAAYMQVGVVLRLPDMPKCFIKDCKTQIDHQHGDKVYGSRVHPFWKKQNPNYGENYPTLIKYKRKNRKKLNPY
ncbi:MAG: hypothetical protein OEX02_03675 [Cyclobacteriaceae bacterium]|nr:hypothetical protein [Cyclobacteriaceae bacterium]